MEQWIQAVSSLTKILLIREIQFTIAQLLIIFTPRNSLLYGASIPIQVALEAIAFPYVQHVIVEPILIHYLCLGGGTVALQTILSISISIMIRLDDKDASVLAQTSSLRGKLRALRRLMNNQRCIGTPYQIKWVPPFDEGRLGYVPSRSEALQSTLKQIVTGYFFRQIIVTLLWERIHLGLFWCLYMASWLNSLYLFGDFIGILFGDPVKDHPPAFASMRYTSTIRGFWGKYWHQSNRYPFQGASNYICKEVLGLRSLVQRYVNIFLVFTLSGAFHVLTDRAEGIPFAQSGAMPFFCSQAVGIIIKDGVQGLYRKWHAISKNNLEETVVPDIEVPVWAKVAGYVWTWTFLSYTAEWFFLPREPMFLQKHGTAFGFSRKSCHYWGGVQCQILSRGLNNELR